MQKCAKKIHEEAHLHIESGPSTDVGGAQAHLGTDHVKVVMRRAHQGAAPQRLPSRPGFHRLMHGGILWRFRIVSYFFYGKPTML